MCIMSTRVYMCVSIRCECVYQNKGVCTCECVCQYKGVCTCERVCQYKGVCEQVSAHTGWEWSAPTTTQPFLPPLKLVLPPLTECKKRKKRLHLMQFDSTLAKCNHHSGYPGQNPV
jgi:hypothetical protein